jgi:hypothetical protein
LFTLRATGKLISHLQVNANPSTPKSTGLLGDWYANLYPGRSVPLVMAVSERTLLPVLVHAGDQTQLPRRIRLTMNAVLFALHVPEEQVLEEFSHMTDCTVAKTINRRVLGAMNDFARALELEMAKKQDLLGAALALAVTPSGPIAMQSPAQATVDLFAAPTLH